MEEEEVEGKGLEGSWMRGGRGKGEGWDGRGNGR